jgi:hypothetical protein
MFICRVRFVTRRKAGSQGRRIGYDVFSSSHIDPRKVPEDQASSSTKVRKGPGRDSLRFSGVPRKLPRGGPFSRPRKVDDLFFGNYHLSTFFLENDNLTTFFLLTDPNPTSIRISKGGRLPVHLFSCLLQAVKKNFPSVKGGPWTPAPPRYATAAFCIDHENRRSGRLINRQSPYCTRRR